LTHLRAVRSTRIKVQERSWSIRLMTRARLAERQYPAAAWQRQEAAMLTRASSLAALLTVATCAGSAAQGFVVDGGDTEARLAEAQGPAQVAGPPAPTAPTPRPKAFEYSDGYRTRLKIHKYASYATLPLFVAQYAVGQKLYNGTGSDSTRSVHGALAATTAALFAVNTVTGVWNMSEGRKDPNHRTKRTIHGVLMLVADAGFVATGMMAPDNEHEHEGGGGGTSASTHRSVAIASMGVATAAYLMMLIH
jgi:hypothetical protein